MDLHHNLFYGYRGPISDEGARERQLENNVTKALVNTLRLGGEPVWRPFLAELGVPDASLPARHTVTSFIELDGGVTVGSYRAVGSSLSSTTHAKYPKTRWQAVGSFMANRMAWS